MQVKRAHGVKNRRRCARARQRSANQPEPEGKGYTTAAQGKQYGAANMGARAQRRAAKQKGEPAAEGMSQQNQTAELLEAPHGVGAINKKKAQVRPAGHRAW